MKILDNRNSNTKLRVYFDLQIIIIIIVIAQLSKLFD